jgi:hypothetical protein
MLAGTVMKELKTTQSFGNSETFFFKLRGITVISKWACHTVAAISSFSLLSFAVCWLFRSQ